MDRFEKGLQVFISVFHEEFENKTVLQIRP